MMTNDQIMTTDQSMLSQWELNMVHDYYMTSLEENKPTTQPGFLTITIITYGSNVFIANNTYSKHSELNCWDLLESKRKKMRKNMDIFVTEVRCRMRNKKFEYSMSQPCLHCTKTFNHYAKYLASHYNSTIRFRWSTDSGNDPIITKFKDIRNIDDSTISTGWALKHNRL